MTLHRLNHFAVQFAVLTDFHGDRILNTRWLNAPAIAHVKTTERIYSYDKRYPAPLLESLSQRHPERSRELSNSPVDRPAISFSDQLFLFKGDKALELTAVPGPTSGSIWMYVPEDKILFVGDTLAVNTHPLLAEAHSAEWLASLDKLAEMAPGLKAIIPGRGPVCGGEAIEPVRQYIRAMRATINQHIAADKPQEETAVYIPEFLSAFPTNDTPPDWLKRQIKLSLDRVYTELKLEKNITETD
jgi:glyoxylase-like metal-dependent hydrolase (beta-lactamase superfamily II)